MTFKLLRKTFQNACIRKRKYERKVSDTNTQTIWIESRPTVLGSRERRIRPEFFNSVAMMEMIEVEKLTLPQKNDNQYIIAEAKLNPRGG